MNVGVYAYPSADGTVHISSSWEASSEKPPQWWLSFREPEESQGGVTVYLSYNQLLKLVNELARIGMPGMTPVMVVHQTKPWWKFW